MSYIAWYNAFLKKEGESMEVSFHVRTRGNREYMSSQDKVLVTRTTRPTMGGITTVGKLWAEGWKVIKSDMPKGRNRHA